MVEPIKEKRARKKRRVEGSATPPRSSFTVRLERSLLIELRQFLKSYSGSRNDYIIELITKDIDHSKRFRLLNVPVTPLPSDLGE